MKMTSEDRYALVEQMLQENKNCEGGISYENLYKALLDYHGIPQLLEDGFFDHLKTEGFIEYEEEEELVEPHYELHCVIVDHGGLKSGQWFETLEDFREFVEHKHFPFALTNEVSYILLGGEYVPAMSLKELIHLVSLLEVKDPQYYKDALYHFLVSKHVERIDSLIGNMLKKDGSLTVPEIVGVYLDTNSAEEAFEAIKKDCEQEEKSGKVPAKVYATKYILQKLAEKEVV